MSIEAVGQWLQATALGDALRATGWLIPALQSIHILMIGVVFVSVLVVALRVLGWVRADEPLTNVWRRFAPFLWWGLLVMAVSGALLTLAEPLRELMALSFRIKMLLLAVGVVGAAAFGRSVRAAAHGSAAGQGFAPLPGAMRAGAVVTVLLWLAVIFLGRAIAYDDSIWGTWSPAVAQGAATP